MTQKLRYSCALATALLLVLSPTMAQTPANTAPGNQTVKAFSQQELDQLLAPIALHPDALLAQILMASTYPLEVVEAARWSKANSKLKGKALEDALVNQPWDPAVKSLAAVPSVLEQMNDKLDWTKKLGDAFLGQQKEVMSTVQSLRAKADAAGNLKSSEQMVVTKEAQPTQTIYVVESPKTEVVYVPSYNPTVVYGTWWYPSYPPYYVYPPAYVYPPGLAFATGIVVGAALWGNCNWNNGDIDIDVNRSNSFNRTTNSNRTFNHNAEHRKGVSYRDQSTSQKFNRGSDAKTAQSRDQFRGRAESGRNELNSMDKDSLNQRAQNADRGGDRGTGSRGGDRAGGDYAAPRPIDKTSPGGGNRAGAGGDRGNYGGDRGSYGGDRGSYGGDRGSYGGDRGSYGGDRGSNGGFSGVGNGASTRDASARGSASRSSMGSRPSGGGARSGGGGARGGGRR